MQKQILLRPVITEKVTALSEKYKKVAFEVAVSANKYQIKHAVEQMYPVQVKDVHTAIMPGKLKKRGSSVGKQPNWKKALVTLKDGAIDFYAED